MSSEVRTPLVLSASVSCAEGRNKFYKVRWKGFTEAADSWEPAGNLHCRQLIADFHARQDQQFAERPHAVAPAQSAGQVAPDGSFEVESVVDVKQGSQPLLLHVLPDCLQSIAKPFTKSAGRVSVKLTTPGNLLPT